jgi:hypothetical protein
MPALGTNWAATSFPAALVVPAGSEVPGLPQARVGGLATRCKRTTKRFKRSQTSLAGPFTKRKTRTSSSKVFSDLPNDVNVQQEKQELSVVFVAIGGLAAKTAERHAT